MEKQEEEPKKCCNNCGGSGRYRVLRDEAGNIDYIRGTFTGEITDCDRCHGEGWIE